MLSDTADLKTADGGVPSVRPFRASTAERDLLIAACIVVACTALFQLVPTLLKQPHHMLSGGTPALRALLRGVLLLVGGVTSGWLAQPWTAAALDSLRDRLSAPARRLLTIGAVAVAALLIATFLITFGRRQFGAWDFGILIETGYRQLLGQRPYVDFAAPTPPFFNWTAALAFRLWGVRWDANLYLAALFSMGTLVWGFALLKRFGLPTVAALGTATTMEVAAMLTCCFWWYNNTTLVLTALFFLACLLLTRTPASRLAQASYVLLLALLPLTKPNTAAPTLAGCIALLLFCSRDRSRLLLLTIAGLAGTTVLCVVFRLPVGAMLFTYREIARERGGLSAFGFLELASVERAYVVLWTAALCVPLLFLLRPLLRDLRARRWREFALLLFYPLAALVSVYALLGNGEYRDVEFPPLLAMLAVLAFGAQRSSPGQARLLVALMCGMVASDIYYGAARLRVSTIGAHSFFEWGDDQQRLPEGFLAHLRGSRSLVETDREVHRVAAAHPGRLFLGPRLDFEYAALGMPSPRGWASFFQPGTAFGRDQTPGLVRAWEQQDFDTLVFLKEDYTFYPTDLLDTITRDYQRDDRYRHLTVYRRRVSF